MPERGPGAASGSQSSQAPGAPCLGVPGESVGQPWGEQAAGNASSGAEPPSSSTTSAGDASLSLATLPAGMVMADALQLLVPILTGFEANKGDKILFFSLFLVFGISCTGQPSNAFESPCAPNKD